MLVVVGTLYHKAFHLGASAGGVRSGGGLGEVGGRGGEGGGWKGEACADLARVRSGFRSET